MKLLRLVPALAIAAVPFMPSAASAGPCATVDRGPFFFYATACVNEYGCFLYQDSGSLIHIQQPVCVSF